MTSHVVCEFEGVVVLTLVVPDQTRIVPEVPAWTTWKQQYQKLVDCCTMPHCRLHVSRSPCDRKQQRKRCCQSAVSAFSNRCGGICCPVVVHWIGTVVSRFGNHCAIGGATSKHEGEMLLLGVTSRISSASLSLSFSIVRSPGSDEPRPHESLHLSKTYLAAVHWTTL